MAEDMQARRGRVERVEEALRAARIYSADPNRRLMLAGKLVDEAGDSDLTKQDLDDLLLEAKEGQLAKSPPGLVVSWLQSDAWLEVLKDIRDARQRAEQRVRAREWQPPDTWAADVQLHRVLAVALGDGKTAEYVASVFGLRPDEVRQMVDKDGRRSYGDTIVDRWLGRSKPKLYTPKKKKETAQ